MAEKKKAPAKKSTAKKPAAKSTKKAPAEKKPRKPTYEQVYNLRVAWNQAKDDTAFYTRRYNRALGIGIDEDIQVAGQELEAAKKAEADTYAAFRKARS